MTAPRTNASTDQNREHTLLAVSSADGTTPVPLEADPTTGALLISGGGTGGADTQYTDGAATATHPIGTQPVFTGAGGTVVAVSSSNPLPITGSISVGSTADESTFTAGTSTTGPVAGVFNDAVASLTTGQQGTIRSTAPRAMHTNLRNNSGTEIGTAATPVQVSLANTAANATGVLTNQGTAAVLTAGWPTINGEATDVTGTFTNATQTTSVTASSLDGYGNTLISINGTYGTATAIFEGSDDGGTTWYTVQAARDNTNVIETGYTSQTNTSQTWQVNNPGFDSLRIRSTAVASGTVNVRLSSSAAPVASGTIIGLGTSIPAGTNVIGHVIADTGSTTAVTGGPISVTTIVPATGNTNLGAVTAGAISSSKVGVVALMARLDTPATITPTSGQYTEAKVDSTGSQWVHLTDGTNIINGTSGGALKVDASAVTQPVSIASVNLSPTSTGGWTPYFANAITTTVAPTAAAGKFGGYMLINLNSTPAYLQVFDTTGAVTLGTTPPTFVIPIPANATAANGLAANVELANGIVIANGIKCAATTTSSGATTVTTGLTGTLWLR